RFLTVEDCSYNRCCAFNKGCIPKLKKYFTCILTYGYFTSLFKFVRVIIISQACENPKRLEACNNEGFDCNCQPGLSCRLTKQMIVDGKTIPVKQCMGDNEEINVEKINVDPEEQIGAANTAYRVKHNVRLENSFSSKVVGTFDNFVFTQSFPWPSA
ncbi:uncharacterized protein LOC111319575, partial [Stylophora pistillata]|uniref:uncharacterized protein LOC111319575 n=1 Tax=Stylophora pistillata TaxID=50429 RepID=UPI000C04DCA4